MAVNLRHRMRTGKAKALQNRLRRFKMRLKYFGMRYFCPMCRSPLRSLKPHGVNLPVFTEKRIVGGGYRKNALCPVCSSTDRERLLYLYIRDRTSLLRSPQRVLHFAPEPGLRRILARQMHLDYLTADLQRNDVMVKEDVRRIQYPNDTFDVVLCSHVLEHVEEDRMAMEELFRVMSAGGWGLFQVPISLELEETFEDFSITAAEERLQAFGQVDHVRIYARDYGDRLESAGFDVEVFAWWAQPGFGGDGNRFGLGPDESLYVARKTGTR